MFAAQSGEARSLNVLTRFMYELARPRHGSENGAGGGEENGAGGGEENGAGGGGTFSVGPPPRLTVRERERGGTGPTEEGA